ncbi:MAG: DUF3867 family protein [Sarcina sp.]
MDDKIVDFSKIQNKVRDKDVDKFEAYIYDLYYKMAEGKMNMMQLTQEVTSYMQENNVSQDKLLKIQEEMLGRYGVTMDDVAREMGMNPEDLKGPNAMNSFANTNGQFKESYEDLRKVMSFEEKYKNRLNKRSLTTYKIKNDVNDIEIMLEGNTVFIKSPKDINLGDVELNEFLCSYKKTLKDDKINIELCSNVQNYIY